MLDERKQAYLKAMGIDVWINAQPPVVEEPVAEEITPAAEPVVHEAAEAEIIQPVVEIPKLVDVSALDWDELATCVGNCQQCEQLQGRTQTVFGVGNRNARLLIIGEAPGADEDKQGEPFVGHAGQLLNAMLKAINLKREEVYIANILKCHPPQNRDPNPEEASACYPYLKRQIELIKPDVILAVGRIAAQRLLHNSTSLTRLRGRQHLLEDINIPVLVTYHPAYLLRSPSEKRKAWEDLLLAADILKQKMVS